MIDAKTIFEPEKVALIGSSTLREKVGMASPELFSDVVFNMRRCFREKIFVVDIAGQEFRKEDVSELPDLAVIMLSPDKSIRAATVCAEAGVRALLLITGGYKNSQRERLLELKHKHKIRILGPNTIMGVINTSNGLNTSFERGLMPKKGNIAVVSQSGGVGSCLLDWACFYEVGISKFAFVGDKVDIDDVDLLQYLGDDDKTNVICLYMEGVKDGRRFIEETRKIATRKPILVLKGGTTQESAQRAQTHTASIAGSDEVFDAAFRKARMIRVGNAEELINSAIALAKQPPMLGDNVAIVSNVGGPAILAADAVVRNGLKLARLSAEVRRKIETQYVGVDATNPIDLIADARAERYERVLNLVLGDKQVDGVLVINMLKSTFFEPKDAKVIEKIAIKCPRKPVVDVPAGGEDFAKVFKVLGRSSIPLYNLPEKAACAMSALRRYGQILEKH